MTISELHRKAIEHTDAAILKRFNGDNNSAIIEFAEAFNLEKEAAMLSIKESIGEPTQSVLLKSAASLALNCEEYREAEKLISLALSNELPNDIAEELRNLLEEVNFERHLSLKGIKLEESELQLVISGKSVGYGLAKSKEIWDRLHTFETMALRTIERILGIPYRESGRFKKSIKGRFQQYISVPRAGSFAFTVRLGEPKQQLQIPGQSDSVEVIDEIINNISLLNQSEDEKLKSIINDDSYYRNFVSLSKELAPDGDDISLVGITVIRNGQEKKTQLTRVKKDFFFSPTNVNINSIVDEIEIQQEVEITGILLYADSEHRKIKIVGDSSKPIIIVPEGLGDIVRNYWEEEVCIKYIKKGKDKILMDINKK